MGGGAIVEWKRVVIRAIAANGYRDANRAALIVLARTFSIWNKT